MVKIDKATWKANYFLKLDRFLEEFSKIIIVSINNVRSYQMQQIRSALRGRAEILNGKNTMIRRALSVHFDSRPELEELCEHVKGNIAFVFTNDDLVEIRDLLLANQISAPAKTGSFAPVDVIIPKGNSGMGPEKTSFFQALNISTKIARGTIEILSDVIVVKEGDRVGPSESALLAMLKIQPFFYGLELVKIFDNGSIFDPDVLDVTDNDLVKQFMNGLRNIASVSLAIGYPTVASIPHSLINGYKNVLALALSTEIDFPQAESCKAYLADPSAFASAAPAAKEEKKEEKAPEPESEESEEDDMMDLFG